MATFQRFVEVEAWRKARELTPEIYKVSGKGFLVMGSNSQGECFHNVEYRRGF